MDNSLTPEQMRALRADGQTDAESGSPAAPALSATWLSLAADKKPGEVTDLLRWGASIYHEGYALHRQGLGALVATFYETGRAFDVENTGGHCMALVLPVGDGTVWVITEDDWNDRPEDDPQARLYAVCRYRDEAWNSEDSNEPETCDTACTADDVVALLDFKRTGHPFQ